MWAEKRAAEKAGGARFQLLCPEQQAAEVEAASQRGVEGQGVEVPGKAGTMDSTNYFSNTFKHFLVVFPPLPLKKKNPSCANLSQDLFPAFLLKRKEIFLTFFD